MTLRLSVLDVGTVAVSMPGLARPVIHIRLIVAPADRTTASRGITARIEGARALFKQLMVRGAIACHEVAVRVVRCAAINVMHRRCATEQLSHRALDNQNVLANVAVPRSRMIHSANVYVAMLAIALATVAPVPVARSGVVLAVAEQKLPWLAFGPAALAVGSVAGLRWLPAPALAQPERNGFHD